MGSMGTRELENDVSRSSADGQSLTVSRPELLADGSDLCFRQLIHDTLAFASRVQEIRNRLGQTIGLTGTAFTILIAIQYLQNREGVGVNQLADHLHLSGAFVTIEVNKLVRDDLVQKRTHPTDRRRVLLTLTEKAEKLLKSLLPVQRPVNDVLFANLSEQDFNFLRAQMADLVVTGNRALALLDYLASERERDRLATL